MSKVPYRVLELFSQETRRKVAEIDWRSYAGNGIWPRIQHVSVCPLGACLLLEFGDSVVLAEEFDGTPSRGDDVASVLERVQETGMRGLGLSVGELDEIARSSTHFINDFDTLDSHEDSFNQTVASMLGVGIAEEPR